ncbi:calpain-15 [Fistulifera solaris]|uniref:Calpain-15 n=1 Tax=Fistulifera solaris TaxID=1519565 RepID=A0A1Z5JJT6_FISSO|nr:calpain-15 [Fistulifera solaris]|eukprot:GAX14041.1 calpain-15 [Fistulifera solaris]
MIVIVDDDSADEKKSCRTKDSHEDELNEKAPQLAAIMNYSDHRRAVALVKRFQGNLEQAIEHCLSTTDNVQVKNVDEERIVAEPRKSNPRALFWEKDERFDETSTPTNSKVILSEQWHLCSQSAASLGGSFVDPDFPPTSTSLDGRRLASRTSSDTETICCRCGLSAAAAVVQKDGPNYGRFYLTCGQNRVGVRKRRARAVSTIEHEQPEEDEEQSTQPKEEEQQQRQVPSNNKVIRNPYHKQPAPLQPSTPSSKKTPSTPSSANSKSPSQRTNCNFFQWDPDGSRAGGYQTRYSLLHWHSFNSTNSPCCMVKSAFDPSQVRQGAVGNCWFLSALATVAEKAYLIENIMPHRKLNEVGCYQVNLCLDGKWTPVIVDSHLPVVLEKISTRNTRSLPQLAEKGGLSLQQDLFVFPAFCAAFQWQLWPALVEKAYAKAHGCYAQLSGGFIAEGLQDLTGAPTETHLLFAADHLWPILMTYQREGFLMGVATARGGDGLIGGHAYSILDVIQLDDMIVGDQPKVTDYFGQNSQKSVKVPEKRQTIRLVRIRNPWGKREWKGDFSASSHRWTHALRKKIGDHSYRKGDGTFFMTFEDMCQRFHHLDVAKTRKGWHHVSSEGIFVGRNHALATSEQFFNLTPVESTLAYITLIQPKKRSNTTSRYWYTDPCFLIYKRVCDSDEWTYVDCAIVGIRRQTTIELFLEHSYQYCCVPFSCFAGQQRQTFPFRVVCYSGETVVIESIPRINLNVPALDGFYRRALSNGNKLLYSVAPQSVLACVNCDGCAVFVALNGSNNYYVSIQLSVQIPQDGMVITHGAENGSYDIPPRSQSSLVIVACNGKLSGATQLSFSYMSSTVEVDGRKRKRSRMSEDLSSPVDLSLSGDLLLSGHYGVVKEQGRDTIDTLLWIPQLGAS